MNFSNRPNKQASKNINKADITKTFKKIETKEKKARKISKKPYKILEAPNLQDDFYLNLIDWSDNNQIAVALDSALYIWSGCSTDVHRLYETSQINDYICSVSFCDDNKIAFGNSNGQIKVYDVLKKKRINTF